LIVSRPDPSTPATVKMVKGKSRGPPKLPVKQLSILGESGFLPISLALGERQDRWWRQDMKIPSGKSHLTPCES
jgi:hypothetical protein